MKNISLMRKNKMEYLVYELKNKIDVFDGIMLSKIIQKFNIQEAEIP